MDPSVNDLARAKQPDKDGACALPQGAIGKLQFRTISIRDNEITLLSKHISRFVWYASFRHARHSSGHKITLLVNILVYLTIHKN